MPEYKILESVSGEINVILAENPRDALLLFLLRHFYFTDQQIEWDFDIHIEKVEGNNV